MATSVDNKCITKAEKKTLRDAKPDTNTQDGFIEIYLAVAWKPCHYQKTACQHGLQDWFIFIGHFLNILLECYRSIITWCQQNMHQDVA